MLRLCGERPNFVVYGPWARSTAFGVLQNWRVPLGMFSLFSPENLALAELRRHNRLGNHTCRRWLRLASNRGGAV